ncbi:MAG: lipoate--protein ligase family protein [Paludibacter sp.]|nr:lipoate--protein ligase family protein [Paludibacter sp.]
MYIIFSDRQDPAYHLALEEYLFGRISDEFALFYVNAPCVIIGCNQVLENEVDIDFCKQNAIPVLRRMSGGGAVYHDFGNLNYSFITNKSGKKTGLNAEFLKPVIAALTYFGVIPLVGKRKDLWLPDGFKISGTAAHITANRTLHHGTLLYDTDLEMLSACLSPKTIRPELKGIASVPSPVKNIHAYLQENNLPHYQAAVFVKKFIEKMKIVEGFPPVFKIDAQTQAEIELLADNKYRSDSWNRKK